ncbi:MAG TPA: hypothetical protein H9795_11075 [Candidatus Fournierella merdigallinarum]|nr:hypothetical protein [Candidatus Fournierella merdigallinarum]
MPLLSGILALLAVSLYSAALGRRFKLDPGLLALPVIAGGSIWLCLWGMAGLLKAGGWAFYLAAGALAVWLAWKKELAKTLKELLCPGFVTFLLAAAFFLAVFSATKPLFTQTDEFSLWGSAAKLTKLQDMLHPAAPGNLLARTATPALMLVSYLFQFFGAGFSEWSAYFALNALLAAAVGAVASLPRADKAGAAVVAACGFLVPYFFSAPSLGGISNIYLSFMGDLPLGFVFGAGLCVWFSLRQRPAAALCLTGLLAAFLVLTKDVGLAYGCILVGLVCADRLFCAPKRGIARRLKDTALAAVTILPGGLAYLGWSRYVAAVTGLGKTTVGSEIHEISQGQAMAEGVAQLLGFMEPTEKFAQVRNAMLASPFTIPVCLLGGGALALALIWLVLAAAALAAPKGERLRPVCLGVFGTLALGAFLIFHLFLYVYNFRETDAANLQDYIRYIGPYYMGFFLMSLGLLARYAAAESRAAKLAGALPAAVLAGFCVLIAWRGLPTAGFWNYPRSVYSVREDVKARAEAVNELLDWEDTVLLISQGDTAIRWNYYGFELNATMARGFGGFGYGHEGDYNWDTTHMNIVSPEAAGEGVPEVYSYQTVASAEDLRLFLLDKKYTHVLVDASDDYIADVIGPAFGCQGLPDDKPDEPVLLAIEYDGDAVRWTRVEGGAA